MRMILATFTGSNGANGVSARATLAQEAAPVPLKKGREAEGGEFNCTATYCYGIGANHAVFEDLQRLLNAITGAGIQVDGKIGLQTLVAARKAAQIAVQQAPDLPRPPVVELPAAGQLDVERFASYAKFFRDYFLSVSRRIAVVPATPAAPAAPESAAPTPGEEAPPDLAASMQELVSRCRKNPSDPICQKAVAACQRIAGTKADLPAVREACSAILAASGATVAAEKQASRSLVWWIVGGAAIAATIGVIGYAVFRARRRRRRRREPAFAGASYRRRRHSGSSESQTWMSQYLLDRLEIATRESKGEST